MAVLVGTVSDSASGKPVPDALVTVTSPNLQGEEIAVTDATGVYRIPGLPPGIYQMRVEVQGFHPYARTELNLHADTTIRLNASLLPESLKAEEVVVVGRTPTVDIGSSATGLNITNDFTSRIPLIAPGGKGSANRSFEAVADVVPGVINDTYGAAAFGSTSLENRYLLDGMSVNNATFGVNGTQLNIDFIKEVSVLSGGYMPEYGRSTGAILNAITKSGTNEWHGSAFSNWAPGVMSGHKKGVDRVGQTIQTQTGLRYQGDIGGDVGGPLIKDKLWIYAGFDWAQNKYNLNSRAYTTNLDAMGNPITDANGNPQTTYIPGTKQLSFAQQDIYQHIAKLTWAANKRNRIDLSVNGVNPVTGGDGKYSIDPTTGQPEISTQSNTAYNSLNGQYGAIAHQYLGKSENALLKWHSELDGQKLYLDTWAGFHHEESGRIPSDGSTIGSSNGLAGQSNIWWLNSGQNASNLGAIDPNLAAACMPTAGSDATTMGNNACPATNYRSGGPEYVEDYKTNRVQLRSILTYLFEGWGHHVLKVGFDSDYQRQDSNRAYTGTTDYAQQAGYFQTQSYGYLTAPDQPVILDKIANNTQSTSLGGFVQDSWNIADKVTMNLGLRSDSQLLYGRDGNLAMALPKELSPRIGLIWDPTQEGHAKLYANYARYYEQVPLRMLDRYLSGEPILITARLPPCNPADPASLAGACQQQANFYPGAGDPPNNYYEPISTGSSTVAKKLKAPATDEFVLGGDYEIIKDGRLGLMYADRRLRSTVDDMSLDNAHTYFFGNPGYGIASSIPKAVRKYDGVTLQFSKAYSQGWIAQASYTVSWLRGNYGGLFNPDTPQYFDPHMGSDFDIPALTKNRMGYLPGDHRHYFKAFVAKDIYLPGEWGFFTPGLSFRAYSGAPTNFLGANPIYQQDQVYILPAGSGERLPWVASLDLRLAYGYQFTKTRGIAATIDIFNLFNFQSGVARDERYTASYINPITGSKDINQLTNYDGTPFDPANKNQNFGHLSAYQPPRTFRFGLKGTF